MRSIMLVAGSTLALAIGAPAFAQTGALNGATAAVPGLGKTLPANGVKGAPNIKPRVGSSNRPSLKVHSPVSRAPALNGDTVAQVKAPLRDTHVVRVRTSSTRGVAGSGVGAGVKHNGVQLNALGAGHGVNTKRQLGVPLTAASSAGGVGHRGLLTATSATGANKVLGRGSNGHTAVGANLVNNPKIVSTGVGGKKH